MKDSDLYRQGATTRRKLLGDKRMEIIFGGIWLRLRLVTKIRIMICAISDTAPDRVARIRTHGDERGLGRGRADRGACCVGAPFVRDAMNAVLAVFVTCAPARSCNIGMRPERIYELSSTRMP